MSWFGVGNRSVNSASTGLVSNPSTATLIQEIDLNGTNGFCVSGGGPWQVNWYPGVQTTLAVFRLEHCLSTGLGDTAIRDLTVVQISSGQSAQFVTKHNVEPGDRFRIRIASSITGNVSGKIIAEPLI